MAKGWLPERLQIRTDALAASSIFLVTLLIFWFSPISQVSDSTYSMLVSETLLHHGSFRLDYYGIPREPVVHREDYQMVNNAYQLELARDHIYYFFPPGGSVLSLPFVALENLLGRSAIGEDGKYNHLGEIDIESDLAALLMALLAAVFFY